MPVSSPNLKGHRQMTKTEEETMTNAPDNPKAALELLLEKGWELHAAYMALVDVEMEHILPRDLDVALDLLYSGLHKAEEEVEKFVDDEYEG